MTDRSFGVPEAVNSGQVGYGIVIDFFAFSSQGAGFPVKFVYPSVTTLVPANVGIVANAPNKAGAEAFVEFLLSPTGQEVLLEPTHPPPAGQPDDLRQGAGRLSQPLQGHEPAGAARPSTPNCRRARTAVVDTLFDQLITFQLEALKAATKALHEVDAALAKKDNAQARALAKEARDLIAAMPITEAQAASPEIAAPSPAARRRPRARPSSSSNGRPSPRRSTPPPRPRPRRR